MGEEGFRVVCLGFRVWRGRKVIESIPRSRDSALLRSSSGNDTREPRKVGRVWKVGEFDFIQAGIWNQKQGIRN